MKKDNLIVRLWLIGTSMVLVALILTVSTYAWFTANRYVRTDVADARSGTEELTLYVSPTGGNGFQRRQTTDIVQVNKLEDMELMPVSTADLKTFVYNPNTVEGIAKRFEPVKDEAYIYHGRIYMRAEADGQVEGSKVAVYLDESEGKLVNSQIGAVASAGRLGLTFDGTNPVIFDVTDKDQGSIGSPVRNTEVNGDLLEADQVLSYASGAVKAVSDPAVPLEERMITMSETSLKLPVAPLAYLELNHTYTVDIYFYLEGCDPDCTDSISLYETDLYLAFYGILEE